MIFRRDSHARSHHHGLNVPAHGTIDPVIFTAQRGIWAIKWSLLVLLATAVFQIIVVVLSGSTALLADTIHNFGDAATAIPLWIAFTLAQRKSTSRLTYGYGRVEDVAGVAIVLIILFSAIAAGYESIHRIFHPIITEYLWAVAVASVIGFLGNEAVARIRIKIGKEIGSAALIADGYHARVDGLTSLAVLCSVIAIWFGFPWVEPLVGLVITIAILRSTWESGKAVFSRLMDAIDPEVIDEIKHAINHNPGVHDVSEIRVRWLGHKLHAEVNISVSSELTVEKGHEIAMDVRHQLLHHLRYLSNATIHVDPTSASGEIHHGIVDHRHDDLPGHSH